jgi:hypothetical protein
VELRRGTFLFSHDITFGTQSIVTGHPSLNEDEAKALGEVCIQKLAAFASTLPGSESLLRSLQLDGYDVDKERLKLVPLEGPVSAQEEEEDHLTGLVKGSGIPQNQTVLQHIKDAGIGSV